jgi:aryl-alcohol dehydrogenase-like predicted oxidoreductase
VVPPSRGLIDLQRWRVHVEYRRLGRTDLRVSVIGLGTMTWGEQNTEAEAHAQLDAAVEAGVNLIDTAEMYPVPPRAETQGRTEACIGSWLRSRGTRDRVVVATKATGPTDGSMSWIRGGRSRFDRAGLQGALEGSLRRLQTDHVDLYQLHWPERSTNYFGRLGYAPAPEAPWTPFEETLGVLADLVAAGKVRHVGLSNETPWGVMRCLALAERLGLPRVASVQNPYSLLNRTFEVGLAEVAHREDVGLLAYSPLGFGVLSGKYLDGTPPHGSRLALYPHYDRYSKAQAEQATRRYVELARGHGLDPAQMALAFVSSRPFLTSTIIGATRLEQLRADLASAAVTLSAEVLAGIEALHAEHPNPAP